MVVKSLLVIFIVSSLSVSFGYIIFKDDYQYEKEVQTPAPTKTYSDKSVYKYEPIRHLGGQANEHFLTKHQGQDFIIIRSPETGEVVILPSDYLLKNYQHPQGPINFPTSTSDTPIEETSMSTSTTVTAIEESSTTTTKTPIEESSTSTTNAPIEESSTSTTNAPIEESSIAMTETTIEDFSTSTTNAPIEESSTTTTETPVSPVNEISTNAPTNEVSTSTTNIPEVITSTANSTIQAESRSRQAQRNVYCNSYFGNCRRFFYPSEVGRT